MMETGTGFRRVEHIMGTAVSVHLTWALVAAVAGEALATVMTVYSKDGTKPREAVQSEIDIYREALKITKPFTPEELEDMSHQKRAYEFLNR